jgi:hypothetical protein
MFVINQRKGVPQNSIASLALYDEWILQIVIGHPSSRVVD